MRVCVSVQLHVRRRNRRIDTFELHSFFLRDGRFLNRPNIYGDPVTELSRSSPSSFFLPTKDQNVNQPIANQNAASNNRPHQTDKRPCSAKSLNRRLIRTGGSKPANNKIGMPKQADKNRTNPRNLKTFTVILRLPASELTGTGWQGAARRMIDHTARGALPLRSRVERPVKAQVQVGQFFESE